MTPEITDKALLDAAARALIDMRADDGDWEAISTRKIGPSQIEVTLRSQFPEPLTCICEDPDSDEIDPGCELCLTGMQPEPDYIDVQFVMTTDVPR